MVDNVVLNAGSGGQTCATDDVAGIQYQRVKLVDGTLDSTAAIPGDAANGLDVDVTRVIPGTTATALGKAEDVAAASGDVGVAILTVRQDTPVASTDVDGDYQAPKTDSVGRLWVNASGVAVPVTDNAGSLTVDNAALSVVGGGVEATAQRVTIASDSTGVLSVDDNGGSLTVDGTVAVSGSVAVTNAGTFAVQADSVIPGTGATNLGKAEDLAHATGDVGVMSLAVRRDADTTLVGTDGDYAPLQVNAAGSLKVAITAGAGSGGTSIADGATFTRNTTSITPAGAVVEAAAPTLTDTDVAGLSMTTAGALRVALTAGGVAGVLEDAAAVGGEEGVMVLAVRRDTASSGVSADGDFAALSVNSVGRLYTSTTIDAALPAGTNNIGDVDVLTLPNVTLAAGTNTNEVVGDAAHDAAIAGNPVRIGARALSADYTAVATGDTADVIASLLGKQINLPFALPGNTWSSAATSGGIVNTTGVTARAAAGVAIRNYVSGIDVVNGHATVSTDFQIRDGAAGTVLWRGFLQAAGGGVSRVFDPPLRGTANTLVEIACGTTGSAVYANLNGFVAAE